MAELRAAHKINGHFYNNSTTTNTVKKDETIRPLFTPESVPEEEQEQYQAFRQALKFHRDNGTKMPQYDDATFYRLAKKNMKRPLTAPIHPAVAQKNLAATQNFLQNFLRNAAPPFNTATPAQPRYNVRSGRYELLQATTTPVQPKVIAQNRLQQLQLRRMEQAAAQSTVVQGQSMASRHAQLRERAAALRKLIASQK